MKEYRLVVGVLEDALGHEPLQFFGGAILFPVAWVDVPPDVAIAELLERSQHPLVVLTGAEWAAEQRARVDARDALDRALGLAYVVAEQFVVEAVHGGVVVRVIADRVPGLDDSAGCLRVRARPAALEKERGLHSCRVQRSKNSVFDTGQGGPAREFRVERQRNLH